MDTRRTFSSTTLCTKLKKLAKRHVNAKKTPADFNCTVSYRLHAMSVPELLPVVCTKEGGYFIRGWGREELRVLQDAYGVVLDGRRVFTKAKCDLCSAKRDRWVEGEAKTMAVVGKEVMFHSDVHAAVAANVAERLASQASAAA